MTNNKILKFTHHEQIKNHHDPYATCNVTSLSTWLSCYNVNVSPDILFERANSDHYKKLAIDNGIPWDDQFAKDNKLNQVGWVLETLADEYLKSNKPQFKTDWLDMQEITDCIDNGNPVILFGLFTHAGHIICCVGYNSLGLIISDPWGDWSTNYESKNGNGITYLYTELQKEIIVDNIPRQILTGSNGKYWGLAIK